ncbi:helicase C-terminal domain-containing protein [Paenibacillus sp. JMULE4]|uniref:helicase C-terminal domain-containing protein n=1 Tax=Paenibacillus sp. JMULE4 TaxID=2518342 RepID=UPI001C2DCA4D|nr:helicase C-terminal domain-containing protein [Paenibacillus sp. JMULE4]
MSQVIIVRLPFPVPDPIIEYKMSLSRNPNDEVLLPEMLIRLRQGAGRLIRSESDKGILSILDSRLSSRSNKKYREAVLSSLPYKQITENIDEVVKFARAKLPPSIRCKNAS